MSLGADPDFDVVLRRMSLDLIRFALVFVLIWLGLGLGLHIVFAETDDRFSDLGTALLSTFLIIFGDLDVFPLFRQNPAMAVLLVVGLKIVMALLVLNLLIAMFNESFTRIQADATRICYLEESRSILKMLDGKYPGQTRSGVTFPLPGRGGNRVPLKVGAVATVRGWIIALMDALSGVDQVIDVRKDHLTISDRILAKVRHLETIVALRTAALARKLKSAAMY